MKITKEVSQKNHGITLIALIITIIVMLILVAVTVTMAVNGGLFEKAAEAGRQTNEKRDQELELAKGETIQDLINKYTTSTGVDSEEEEDFDNPSEVCAFCNDNSVYSVICPTELESIYLTSSNVYRSNYLYCNTCDVWTWGDDPNALRCPECSYGGLAYGSEEEWHICTRCGNGDDTNEPTCFGCGVESGFNIYVCDCPKCGEMHRVESDYCPVCGY